MKALWPVLTSLLALGRDPSASSLGKRHGYRPRKGSPSPPKPPPPDVVRLQVCLSPGCTADGAQATLEKMQALAPANVIVEPGSCASLCGSGPVVMQSKASNPDSVTKAKRIKEDERIMQILYPTGGAPTELVEGYELVQRGDAAFSKENYKRALELYERAVNVAFRSAIELENERDYLLKQDGSSSRSTTRVPKGLEWLIRARRNEATCQLKLGDVDGAMLAAQASCNLSRNTSAESFLLLGEIYKIEGGLEGEAQALEKAISLWSDESKLNFAQKNQRRITSIRLQKVQREKSLAKPKVSPDDLVSLQQNEHIESNGAPGTNGRLRSKRQKEGKASSLEQQESQRTKPSYKKDSETAVTDVEALRNVTLAELQNESNTNE